MTTLGALILCAAVHIVMSVAAFGAFAFDKRRTRAGGRRVPERTLHLLSLLGGWPGSALAIRALRHKTRKTAFLLLTIGAAAADTLAWLVIVSAASGWLSLT